MASNSANAGFLINRNTLHNTATSLRIGPLPLARKLPRASQPPCFRAAELAVLVNKAAAVAATSDNRRKVNAHNVQ